MHKQQVEFYQKVQVMLPLCGTIVVIMVGVVAIFLFCRRRKERLRYKGELNIMTGECVPSCTDNILLFGSAGRHSSFVLQTFPN